VDKKFKKFWFVFLAVLMPGLAVAQAPQSDPLNGKFSFRIGAQAFTKASTTIRIDSATLGIGTEFNLEDATNLEEDVTVGRLDGLYRFTDRHSVAFSYYNIERTGSRTLNIDIDWNGVTFPIGIGVESQFNEKIVDLSYGYTFLNRPNATLAATAGLHVISFDTSLRALNGSITRSNSTDAPLPVFGLSGQYRFADKWRFVGSLKVFSFDFDEYDGTFTDLVLSVEHDTWDRFGFGFGLNSFGLDVSASDSNLSGSIDTDFDSFLIYIKGHFGSN
jgi:opacity protein-like surface antigen